MKQAVPSLLTRQLEILFNTKCASCHATDLMTDDSFRNNGLAINPLINDVGRYRVTQQEQDYYKFKVPSLRNVEVPPICMMGVLEP
jgi:cytochrome c peroxidase